MSGIVVPGRIMSAFRGKAVAEQGRNSAWKTFPGALVVWSGRGTRKTSRWAALALTIMVIPGCIEALVDSTATRSKMGIDDGSALTGTNRG